MAKGKSWVHWSAGLKWSSRPRHPKFMLQLANWWGHSDVEAGNRGLSSIATESQEAASRVNQEGQDNNMLLLCKTKDQTLPCQWNTHCFETEEIRDCWKIWPLMYWKGLLRLKEISLFLHYFYQSLLRAAFSHISASGAQMTAYVNQALAPWIESTRDLLLGAAQLLNVRACESTSIKM